ncbi:SGNH/GDSL hydrolase family protein [Neobacillus sp. D3-1R]|uniref:SGNH/GDSL hydrolase family protein n=1 Tax=Neobacillus sp. D3-1R TaxID=3445778 RepID=UPI003FA06311
MYRKKAIILIASLLTLAFLLYLFLPDFNPSKQVSVSLDAPASVMKKQVEKAVSENSVTEEEQSLQEEDETTKPVTEEIKEKVRAVLEGAIEIFKKDEKIVAIGDSLTQGVGDETESGGYVGILNHTFEDNHINITIENYGKRGNRSDQLLKRLDEKKIASSIKEADIVLITIGANDIMKVVKNNITHLKIEQFQEEREGYVERLKAIFNKINELNPDAQIYIIGFYNPFELYFSDIEELGIIIDTWNETGRSVSEEYDNVIFVPTKDLFVNPDLSLLSDDYFHPNTSGYKLMAQRVLDYLKVYSENTEITTEEVE